MLSIKGLGVTEQKVHFSLLMLGPLHPLVFPCITTVVARYFAQQLTLMTGVA